MGTGRDDFTRDTIRRAAGRVGYHCSFPGCTNATIGASMESPCKIAITGVAAHICAAAEGGPRYDKKMSVDERRGIENCIWLCQTHAKLIDVDEKTYPVEILRQWKANAEAAASAALANGDYFAEYYKSHGNNLILLKQMFDDMIVGGQFDLLQTMLAQYKTTLSEQYEEFVLRYRIIYEVYCDRAKLGNHLDHYCNLVCKTGADALAELLLSFHLNNELRKVIGFCSSEQLKKYAGMELKGELINLLIAPVGTDYTIDIPFELCEVISKYITNYIVQNKIIGAIDVTGSKYQVFSDEFYYRAVKAVYELSCASIYGKGNFEDIVASSDFLFIRDNINKIILLDDSLQEYIWGQFLTFLSVNSEQFETYYGLCPPSLKCTLSVEKAYYIYKLTSDTVSVERTALLDYVSKSGDDTTLCIYLSNIEKSDAIEFLDEHSYLFKKNSIYLKVRLDLMPGVQSKDACDFLEKYKLIYADDFTFHLLLAKHATSVQSLNDELGWLRAEKLKMRTHDVIDYIRILYENQCWTDLFELSQVQLPNECMFILASYLSASEDGSNVKSACNLYQSLVDVGWERRYLYFNLGVAQRKLGDFENAKENFRKEYDLYAEVYSLSALIQLRYELNEYETDSYFNQLTRCIDANSQNLVAAIYLKRRNYLDARKHFLKSLLLNDIDNPSINGFYSAVSQLPHGDINIIGENVCCTLKNTNGSYNIAIHENDILEDIVSPNTFADYSHYSVQDAKVSSILFAVQGDSVIWDEEEYEVIEIMSVNDAITRFFFSTLSKKENVTLIQSSSSEDSIEQLSHILKKSTEDLMKRINDYNQSEIRLPLSTFAASIGKGRLKVCEFLAFENSDAIRNNISTVKNTDSTSMFVLSYDSIVYLTHLGIESALNDFNLRCSKQVKNQLINDINEELTELTDNGQKGTMFYEGGKVSLLERTSNMRRVRHAFLTRLKNFLNSIQILSDTSFSSCSGKFKSEIEQLLSSKQLYCESTSLAATKNTPGAVLVTDDQFLFTLANTEGISCIGLTGLISSSKLHWEKLLSVSKKLHEMNYANYLPVHLYKRIVDQMLSSETDRKKASAEIQAWILSDTDGDATPHHEDVVVALFREVFEQKIHYLNPNNYLTNMVLCIYEKRNPGFINQCLSSAFKSLLGTGHEVGSY